MITFEGVRFACDRCIGGHRPASCAHTERALKEVRAKGRPSTQCDHCRSRRTGRTGSHVRCVCGVAAQVLRGEPKIKLERGFNRGFGVRRIRTDVVTWAALCHFTCRHSLFAYSKVTFEDTTLELHMTPDDPAFAHDLVARLTANPETSIAVSTAAKKSKEPKEKDSKDTASDNGSLDDASLASEPTDARIVNVRFAGARSTPVQDEAAYKLALENPCSCKVGGTCICSSVGRSARKPKRPRGVGENETNEQQQPLWDPATFASSYVSPDGSYSWPPAGYLPLDPQQPGTYLPAQQPILPDPASQSFPLASSASYPLPPDSAAYDVSSAYPMYVAGYQHGASAMQALLDSLASRSGVAPAPAPEAGSCCGPSSESAQEDSNTGQVCSCGCVHPASSCGNCAGYCPHDKFIGAGALQAGGCCGDDAEEQVCVCGSGEECLACAGGCSCSGGCCS